MKDSGREYKKERNEFREDIFADYEKFSDEERSREKRRQRQKKREIARRRRRRKVIIVLSVSLSIVLVFCGVIFAINSSNEKDEVVPVAAPLEPNVEDEALSSDDQVTAPVSSDEPSVSASSENTDESSDYTRVINRSYPIPPDYIAGTGELISVENGKQMEQNAGNALMEMVSALRATGMDIIVQSGYRTDSQQQGLFDRQVGRQGGDEIKAGTISAVPLTSEHQAGLSVDLSTDGTLTEAFASTAQGQWLNAHCMEYGFILRYPDDKTTVTGIISEPWHFRYVGSPETAKAITNSGLCMEEYYNKTLKPEDIDPYLPYLQ